MCGIIWHKRIEKGDPVPMIKYRYEKQRSRGTQGYGFVALGGGKVVAYERAETEAEIYGLLDKVKDKADEIIFHHRMPTSTPNFKECAHPIKVTHPDFKHDWYVIHNGIILQDDKWKKEHEKLGFKYSTEIRRQYLTFDKLLEEDTIWNDSEAMATELAYDLEHEAKGIDVDGSIAFVALAVEKGGDKAVKLYFGRNTSPIVMDTFKDVWMMCSSEGTGTDTKPNRLYTYDYATKELTDREYKVGSKAVVGYDRLWDEEEERTLPTYTTEEDSIVINLCEEYDQIQRELETNALLDAEQREYLEGRKEEINQELDNLELVASTQAGRLLLG